MMFLLLLMFDLVAGKNEVDNKTEVCLMEPDDGPCRALWRRWAWDPVEERCEPFYYGGCRGNGNRFKTPQQCLDECWNKHVDEEHWKKPVPKCIKYIK
ncbi:hypothetical protein RB195_003014 [Necator americanus]|uniref:BPTI/Kunitz inhibitor domain-containing protein n=1 Tax=Necator americanus TaxID=51031 RepID=A0ABR1DLU7_NECAM